MDRDGIINMLNNYNFDKDKYMVLAGAAMTLMGLKEKTTDIDIAVTEEYYNYLLQNYDCEFEITNEYGIDVYFIDNIINFSTSYFTKEKDYICGIPIQRVDDIIKFKKSLNRKKDILDVQLLEKYIEENNKK